MEEYSLKRREDFYKIMEQQTIQWNLIDSGKAAEDGFAIPIKPKRKRKPKIEIDLK